MISNCCNNYGPYQFPEKLIPKLISNIFNPEEEVLTYESLDECISKLDLLRKNRDLRISLARNAYKKAISNYQYKNNLIDLFSWFKKIKKDEIH